MSLAIDEKKLKDVDIDPLVDRVENEIIPGLQSAAEAIIKAALTQLRPEIQAALDEATTDANAILTGALNDARAIIESLDGWTLTVDPILIPAITLRLSKPRPTVVTEPIIVTDTDKEAR